MMVGMPTAGPAETALIAPLASARQTYPRSDRSAGRYASSRLADGKMCLGNGVLPAQPKALDQLLVAPFVLAPEIVQQPPALPDHDQQTAARVEILLMRLQMIG